MGLKFRRGSTAQQSGSLAFGEPYVNTTLGTLVVGGATGDIVLSAGGTGSTGNFGAISGSGLDITGNANIAGNLTLGGQLTIGDNTSDVVNVVASLSSSLIPQTTNVFDLGSATKIWRDLYISTGSIKFVAGTTVVKELTLATISGLESATGSSASTGSNTFYGIQTITGSLLADMVNGPAVFRTISGTALIVSGGVEINNGVSYPVVIKDNFVVSGSTVLGDNSSDTIEISGSLKVKEKAIFASSFGGAILEVTGGVSIENGMLPVKISNNLIVSGSTILGTDSSDTISISGSLNTNQKATFATQYGTVLEITGGVEINNGISYPVVIKDNFIVSGSTILGDTNTDLIEISGSLKTNQKVTFVSPYGIGTALEITGAVEINNGISYPVVIKDNFIVSGSTILGTDSSDTISISGSLNTNQKATFATQYGTVLEITGGVEINNGISYPVTIKDNLVVTGSISGSNIVATTGIYGNIYSTNGVVSGSSQITYASISSIPSGIVSGSSQITAGSTTNFATDVKTQLNSNTVVSGSSQVTLSSTTGYGTVINQNLLTTSNVQHASLGIGMAASGTSGRIDAANDIVAFSSSDIRFKENITPIENALDKISKISGNTYDWKAENKAEHGYEGNDVGVIAQEIEAVLPQLVQTRESGFKAVKYDKLVALLIEGIKEQQQNIDNLTIQVEELKKQKGL